MAKFMDVHSGFVGVTEAQLRDPFGVPRAGRTIIGC
jgi:hypothetical protein